MKKRRKIKVLSLLIIIAVTGVYLSLTDKTPEIDRSKIAPSSIIEYPSEFNYLQTANDCGPFNVAAIVRALTEKQVDSQEFAENIEWRLPNKYTLPWGMERQLKENGMKIEIPNVKALSDDDKIAFLQEQLSYKKPIIILGERDDYEHYMTIFGFDRSENEFYIYDSLFDKDANDDLPGNRNFTSEELLNFWRDGGMYGLYEWYAIVNSYL